MPPPYDPLYASGLSSPPDPPWASQHSGEVPGVANAYSRVTDGANTASAVGADQLTLLSSDGAITILAENNNPNYGDLVTFTLNPGAINYTLLGGYDADRFIDHSSVNIIAGAGLTGGGPITEDVTLAAIADGAVMLSDAVGDNDADDSTALQAWLSNIAAGGSLKLPRGAFKLTQPITVTISGPVSNVPEVSMKGLSRFASRIVCYGAGSVNLLCTDSRVLIDMSDFSIEPGEAGVDKLLNIEYPPLGARSNCNFQTVIQRMNFCPQEFGTDYSAIAPVRTYGAIRLRMDDVNITPGRDALIRSTRVLDLEETYQAKLTRSRVSGDGDFLIYKKNAGHNEGFIVSGNELVGCDWTVWIENDLGAVPGLEITHNRIARVRRNIHVDGIRGTIAHNDMLLGDVNAGTYVRSGAIVTCTCLIHNTDTAPKVKHWFDAGVTTAVIRFTSQAAGDTFTINSTPDDYRFTVIIPLWVTLTAYTVGDYVRDATTWYRCKTANSDAAFTPANWDVVPDGTPTPGEFIITSSTRPFEYIGVQETDGLLIEGNVMDGSGLSSSRAVNNLDGGDITGLLVGQNHLRYTSTVAPYYAGDGAVGEIMRPTVVAATITASRLVELHPTANVVVPGGNYQIANYTAVGNIAGASEALIAAVVPAYVLPRSNGVRFTASFTTAANATDKTVAFWIEGASRVQTALVGAAANNKSILVQGLIYTTSLDPSPSQRWFASLYVDGVLTDYKVGTMTRPDVQPIDFNGQCVVGVGFAANDVVQRSLVLEVL